MLLFPGLKVIFRGALKGVKLNNVEQPLYAGVDAIGEVLGTVRVAIPYTYPYRKEADGVSYTVAEEPTLLNLWRNDRTLWDLRLRELIPKLENEKEGFSPFFIYSSIPEVNQRAFFRDQKNWMMFIKALKQRKICLIKQPGKAGNILWYLIATCACPSDEELRKEFQNVLSQEKTEKSREKLFVKLRDERYRRIESNINKKRTESSTTPEIEDIWLGLEGKEGTAEPLPSKWQLDKHYECKCKPR